MIVRSLIPLVLAIATVSSYKVLVYNTKFGFSHMNFMGSLADTLSKAGHDVTVLQAVLSPTIEGTGSTHAKVISVDFGTKATEVSIQQLKERRRLLWTTDNKNPFGVIHHVDQVAAGFDNAMKNVLNRTDIMDQLRAEKFDVAIGELFDYGGFPIFYELGITNLVGAQSAVLTDRACWAVGCPILPSFIPPMHTASGDDGSFFSRLSNFVFTFFSWEFERVLENQAQKYMNEHHPGAPTIQEMVSNLSFVFTNNEPLLDFPRPVPFKVVDLGGIGTRLSKPLNEEWVALLNKRKTNVLISFGSIVPSSMMPAAYKNSIVSLAKKYPEITFIWKYDNPEDGISNGIDNLHLSTWTPQTALLASGKIDLFVTHGGAGSIMETAASAVPVIAISIFGDQARNALMAERFGFGKVFEKFDLADAEKVETTVISALKDRNLKEAANKAQTLLASRPFTPQEKLLKYMDLAVKFGGPPTLSPNGRTFSIIQYHNLDIWAFVVLLAVSIVTLIVTVTRFIASFFVSKKVKLH